MPTSRRPRSPARSRWGWPRTAAGAWSTGRAADRGSRPRTALGRSPVALLTPFSYPGTKEMLGQGSTPAHHAECLATLHKRQQATCYADLSSRATWGTRTWTVDPSTSAGRTPRALALPFDLLTAQI